ncbi:FapA family protein [Ectothiorhodospira mobilis]|uniref:FapA family protein n=1 Tax=Ectothiorhodospira mobilis TaxID=195064 RepID=UPI001EE7D454|nr:FapA family protein [Ectothiorhodospira mobilis]MCG5535272.1 FapA family protein [Ectothiorhodospira mobilis]
MRDTEGPREPVSPPPQFHTDETGTALYASPPSPGQPLDADLVRAALGAAGYGDWAIIDEGMKALTRGQEGDAPVLLARALDGAMALKIQGKGREAVLHLDPPQGGQPVTLEQVREALAQQGVVHGIDEAALEAAVEAGKQAPQEVVVAEATPPEHGEDTRFEPLVPEAHDRRPRVDERGRVDYRDLGGVVQVSPGTPLMRRHPATPGTPGRDIFGGVIPSKPGKEYAFDAHLRNAERDPEDPDLLRAAIQGVPSVVDRGVMVDDLLQVDGVDLSVGHLTFDGTVQIRHDVVEGMHVEATGDIHVGGMVEGARLEAGGDIVVHKGVVGRLDQGEPTAVLRAGGGVSAHFIENGRVEAHHLLVREQLVHCHVSVRQSVMIGPEGARKGQIMGGEVRAGHLVDCRLLGGPNGPHTVVAVGLDPQAQDRLAAVEAQLEEKRRLQEELDKALRFAHAHPERVKPDFLERAGNTLAQTREAMAALEAEREERMQALQQAQGACIQVRGRAYPGVEVRIGDRVRRLSNESVGGLFLLREGEIIFDHAL